MDQSTFYVVTAGAAATLIGLLFIAVQFNVEAFAQDPGDRWHAVARSTFAVYTTLFLLPMTLLIPNLDNSARAYTGFIFACFGIFRVIMTWIPVWRGMLQRGFDRLWQTTWLLLAPVAAYVSLAYFLRESYLGNSTPNVQWGIDYSLIGLFSIALRNSWNLLAEVTYERKRKDAKLP